MTTGAHPILPLYIQEATWLSIGFRAKALAKHCQHVEEMSKWINQRKHEWLLKYKKENWYTMKDLNFQLGNLILIWNIEIKSSLDKRKKPRYMEPMVVIS